MRFESRYLVYAEKVRTAQVYIRDASPVSPYALMLFGGGLSAEKSRKGGGVGGSSQRGGGEGEEAVMVVDGWIRFRVPRRVEALIIDVREKLASLLMQKIERPTLELSSAGKGLLNAVTALLGQAPPDA